MRNVIWISCMAILLLAFQSRSALEIVSLKCEYEENPVAIETTKPRFSWKLSSSENGQRQTAYQILVASNEMFLTPAKADMWNSGKVTSDQSLFVEYKGKPLTSKKKYWWKVMVWDKNGKPTSYGTSGSFQMGLLDPSKEFIGAWLRHPDHTDTLYKSTPAPYFRKTFSSAKKISNARAYVTGLGYFVFHVNGQKIGDHVLDPVATRYDKSVKYVVFDITDKLKRGENCLGIILGTGWYNHFANAAWDFNKAPWRNYPTFKLMIDVTYDDGTAIQITSDTTWKTSYGPIIFDGIRNGEVYDARLEMKNWDKATYNDSKWKSAVAVTGPSGDLSAQSLPPIKEMAEIKPASVKEVKPGVYLFDLGQNIAGYCRIKIKGNAGDSITLIHGERLYEDGTVEQEEILRFLKTGKAQTDTYILKGEKTEVWSPRFVYHGFQYIEVRGLNTPPSEDFLTGIVIHTAFDKAGSFTCSNELYNQTQHNTLWSFIGNYHGFPTDCPHREKIGWTGDAQLTAETGLLNFDIASSYRKWMNDFEDEQRDNGQLPGIIPTSGWGYIWTKWINGKRTEDPRGYGPAWESAYIQIPWYVYQYTGDQRILEEHYEGFVKYVNYLHSHADDYIINFGMGDHAAPRRESNASLTSTGYFYSCSKIVSAVASLLGKEEDAVRYEKLAEKIKDAFHKKFWSPHAHVYADTMQTSLAAPVYFGLVPDSLKDVTIQQLKASISKWDGHLNTGILGTKFLLNVLAEEDEIETTYIVTNKRTYPSYGYWIEQGANTLWQKWNGGSRNHIMYGDISAWFFKHLAGIQASASAPGFKHFQIRPQFPKELAWVKASHESGYGTIASGWKRTADKIELEITVPVNTTATLALPNGYVVTSPEGISDDVRIESGKHRIFIVNTK